MNHLKLFHAACARLPWLIAGLVLLTSVCSAQTPGTGAIQGRVLNLSNGSYLNNARVTLEGTTREAFTDSFGEFRLDGVPAGTARLHVFYTGLTGQDASVEVTAGGTVRQDFSLSPGQLEEKVVQLETFTVTAERELNGSAIAINEQRFAPNIKNVVASDEFGAVTEGNVGEFVKFLPGVSIEYFAADARSITVRGLPSNYTPITMDGNRMSSAGSSQATRTVELEQLSINNVARVEVNKSNTPDMPADALGGSINLVPKRAFERVRPEFNYRAYLSLNSDEFSLGKSVGPTNGESRKTRPNGDFSFVVPVSNTFGFTLTGLYSDQFNPQHWITTQWLPIGAAGSNTAVGVGYGTVANPMLRSYTLLEGPKITKRSSVGTTVDWKFTDRDVLSIGADYNSYDAFFGNRNGFWSIANTGFVASPLPTYGPTFSQGGATATGTGTGEININTSFRHKTGSTYNVNLGWRHTGPVWGFEGSAYLSHSTNHYRDVDEGHFDGAFLSLSGLVMRFDSAGSNPGAITATKNGVPVDINDLRNYTITGASTNPFDSKDVIRGLRLSAKRQFDLNVPVTLKTGFEGREQLRDITRPISNWTFPGNGVDKTVASYGNLLDGYTTVPFGLPKAQFIDPYKVYDLYKQHPEYFTFDQVALARNTATNSNRIKETTSAGYARLDTRLFKNRLILVGGVRYEQTEDDSYGVKNDISATYVRDANGKLTNVKKSTDPLVLTRLQYQERGSRVQATYDDYYPSANASFLIRDNLIFRLAYARTMGRPNLNEILPSVTQPDPNTTATNFTVNNSGLKPWTAENYDASLEYYFGARGNNLLSAGVFRKTISDFFLATPALPADQEFYDTYGIDSAPYIASGRSYTYTTKSNGGDAQIDGLEFNYRQALTFLPEWARGVQVFGNLTYLHLQGSTTADFSQFIRQSINWGVSLSRPRYSVKLNWNFRGTQRLGAIATTATNGVEPGTYNYFKERLTLDATVDVTISKKLGLFLSARNITNEPIIRQAYGPSAPEYARNVRIEDYGVQFNVGVRGTF
ncbi:MAG TPA: TonB-dependent receptor [Lacunisphaera sp.]